MKCPGVAPHGASFRLRTRIPADVAAHYPTQYRIYKIPETDPRKAHAAGLSKLAEWEQEYQRIRETGSALKRTISAPDLERLIARMLQQSLSADEEMRAAGDYAAEDDFAAALRRLASDEAENRLELAQGLFRHSQTVADDWLMSERYELSLDEYRRVVFAFAKARAQKLAVVAARMRGDWVDTPPPPAPATPKPPPGLMLSAVCAAFLKRPAKGDEMAKVYRSVMPVFMEVVGDKPVRELLQQDIEDFFALLCRLPPRWDLEKARRKATLRELAEMDWPKCLAPKTVSARYTATLRRFLKDSIRVYRDQGFPSHLTVEGIQYSGVRKTGERTQRALTSKELMRLFTGPEYREFAADPEQADRYWLPLVGLFTGARINELCQINPQGDIREERGIPFFEITEEGDADSDVRKTVKNKSSRRRVPIHPELLRLGFLDYVERIKRAGSKRLFPAFKPMRGKASARAEVWFRDLLKATGLRDEAPGAAVVGFHCFRSTFLNRAINVGEHNAHWITGHVDPQKSGVVRTYQGTLDLEPKRAIVGRVTYELELIPPRHDGPR